MKSTKNTEKLGPTIKENAKRKRLEEMHAAKMHAKIKAALNYFFAQAKDACPTQDATQVRLRLEGTDEKQLFFVAEYLERTSGEYRQLGHEKIRLNRGYSLDKWDGNTVFPVFRFTYCPIIGSVIYFKTEIEMPLIEYPF